MRKAIEALCTAAFLLSGLLFSLHIEYAGALPSKEYVYGDTVVYSRSGTGVNVSLALNSPDNKERNSTVTFALKIHDSFSNWGDVVDPSGYDVVQVTLDYYLISGVILDFDMTRAVDSLWIYWGDSLNKTHVEEEISLYSSIYGGFSTKSGDTYFGSAVLPDLAQGAHNLTVWVRAEHNQVTTYDPIWTAFSKTTTFTIDTVAPSVSILPIGKSMLEKPELILNLTVSELPSRIEYSLDGQDNVTINGNTTIFGLLNGNHSVTVYVTDKAGNTGASEPILFSVSAPVTLPIAPLVAAAVAVTIGLGLSVYFKKRHSLRIA